MEIPKVNAYATQTTQRSKEQSRRISGEEKSLPSKQTAKESDSVKLSSGYQEMAQVKKVMMSREDIRAERVDQLRSQIESGSYVVEPEKVAGKMLEDAL